MPKKNLTSFQKGEIIGLCKAKWSKKKISTIIEVPRSTVRRIIKNYEEKGAKGMESKKGSGRPKKTTTREDKSIIRTMLQDRKTTALEIKNKLQLPVCPKTIRNRLRLRDKGFSSKVALKNHL